MNSIKIKDMDIVIDLNNLVTTIIGPANSGKTTIAKRLCNKIANSQVYIDDLPIQSYDYEFLRSNIVVVLDDNNYKGETIIDELIYNLELLNFNSEEITTRVEDILKYFKIKKLVTKPICSLYLEEKILIKILALLIIEPSLIVIDNLLVYLRNDKITLLLKYLKEKNIKLINLTTNTDELFISDEVIVINNFKKVLKGDYKSILDGNSILPYMGLKLPFITELSNNLILYNVINKLYYDNGKLVNTLWK